MGSVLLSLPSHGSLTTTFLTGNTEIVKSFNFQLGYIHDIHLMCFRIYSWENVHWMGLKSLTDGSSGVKPILYAFKLNTIDRIANATVYPDQAPRMEPEEKYFHLAYSFEGEPYFRNSSRWVEKNSREYIDSLEVKKMIWHLCLFTMHGNQEMRIWSLEALKRMKDPRCIPYLIDLARFYKDIFPQGDENGTIFQVFCRTLVETLDALTGCYTLIPFGTDQEQFRLGLGLTLWDGRIKRGND